MRLQAKGEDFSKNVDMDICEAMSQMDVWKILIQLEIKECQMCSIL